MSSWGQKCGCRNHTSNTNVGCPYNVKSGVCDDCKKYCIVRDERSEESAVKSEFIRDMTSVVPRPKSEVRRRLEEILQAERTRIIKALERLYVDCPNHNQKTPSENIECWGYDEYFNLAVAKAIKAVGESYDRKEEDATDKI